MYHIACIYSFLIKYLFSMCKFKKQIQSVFLVLGLLVGSYAWGNSPESVAQTEPASSDEVITQELYLGNSPPEAATNSIQPDNTVVAFFWNVELRYIVDGQMNDIIQALTDMTTLSASQLQQQRYADFYGSPDEWTLLQLLYAYFVPETEVPLDRFYMDIEKPESRQIVRQTLSDIQAYLETGEQSGEQTRPAAGW